MNLSVIKHAVSFLNTPIRGLEKSSYRSFVAYSYGIIPGIAAHVFFMVVFKICRIDLLFFYQFVAIAIWLFAFYLLRRGLILTCAVMALGESIVHQVICVMLIGWSVGFQSLLLVGPAVVFVAPPGKLYVKLLVAVATTFAAIFSYLFSIGRVPMFELPNPYPAVLAIFIIVQAVGTLAIVAQFFSTAVARAEAMAEREHNRSEALLHNILPDSIAARLKAGEATIVDYFDQCSILFADIVGFTTLSSAMKPGDLVSDLNNIFSLIDKIAEKYGLEKIKTIGDAYMVAAGIPNICKDHAERIADFALELVAAIQTGRIAQKQITVRVGINTGPVVAGVIGKMKFSYDLWGDSVNTASRMESNGIAGEINVSQSTHEALKSKYVFESRGLIAIKGKGEMETFLLKCKK